MAGVVKRPDITAVVAKTTEFVGQRTISIPRIVVVPKGEARSGFKPFTLDLKPFNYPTVSEDIWIHHLRTGDREILSLQGSGSSENRLENYVVRGLVDFDDVSYDDHADLLYDLAKQVVDHFRGYLKASDEEVARVLQCHQRDIAKFIHSQMQEHH